VPIRILTYKPSPPYPPGTPYTPAESSWVRLNSLWELMRMELPDRKSDVIDPPVFLKSRPALSRAYLRRANAATGGNLANWSTTHESAECLYMILANMRDGDGVATDLFTSSEVGDTDGDGMPEFIDPWGLPIYFLRWAPNLTTPLQDKLTADPFDPYRAGVPYGDPTRPWNPALFPFVYSAGPDGVYGYDHDDDLQYSMTCAPPAVYALPPGMGTTWSNNPYYDMSTAGNFSPVSPTGAAAGDDIHNHITE
jgi:hypothetical protein